MVWAEAVAVDVQGTNDQGRLSRRQRRGLDICPPPHYSLIADHLALLETMQRQGLLGCFALTEKLAGVNSGLGESIRY